MTITLESIIKHDDTKPPFGLVYGPPGIGKTTLGANAPSPIFIRTEDGLIKPKHHETGEVIQVDTFPLMETYYDVLEAIDVLIAQEHDFKWCILDSLSKLETLIHSQVCDDHNVESIESLDFGKGYVFALNYWQQVLDGLKVLRDHKSVGILMLAHADIVKFNAPDTESYDRYQIAINKKAFHLLYQECDIIGFANYKVRVRKEDAGFGKKESRGVSTGERILHFIERPGFVAKNRYGMPESIPLSWQNFCDLII